MRGKELIKRSLLEKAATFFSLIFIQLVNAQLAYDQIRIMPLGDSITMGRHGEPAGYRDDLSFLLQSDRTGFTMVGSVNDGTGFYPFHEGHSGWESGEIDVFINYWLDLNPADIVLLHIGTNDISHQIPNQNAIQHIESIVDKIKNKNAQTKILLCSLVPRWDDYENRPQRTDELNALIYQLYNQKLRQGYHIYFVDQSSAFYANLNWQQIYMDDFVHPNDTGYHIMALTLYDVLHSIIYSSQYYLISGNILYYVNDQPINDARINLISATNASVLSNSIGFYIFNNLAANQSYTVQLEKNRIDRSKNSIITMYDAALTLRHAVGVDNLATNAQIAADVDKNSQVIAYDAALIARYVVELAALENDHVGEWSFLPASRNYQNLSANNTGQNYTGILLGDVSGAWHQNDISKATTASLGQLLEINVGAGELINYPISLIEDSLLSFYIELEFPTELMEFQSITENPSLENNQNFIYSLQKNRLKLGGYSYCSNKIETRLLDINFLTKEKVAGSGLIRLKRMQINNSFLEESATKINIASDNHKELSFELAGNYPNPFNASTVIPYKINQAGHVKIMVYDLMGRHIRTILDKVQQPGFYQATWNGQDKNSTNTANGVYVYSVYFNSEMLSKTMLKLE